MPDRDTQAEPAEPDDGPAADSADRPAKGLRRADMLGEIIAFLHERTGYDFKYYKPGTLRRRIERRMATHAIPVSDAPRYLDLLRTDPAEPAALADDLLIHVTSFFRDEKVFAHLEIEVIPGMLRALPVGQSLRVWVAGCSTGEEAYSLAMLLREQIAASEREVTLQIFASDVDPTAIAFAREGLYPAAIAGVVSAARLARHFTSGPDGYRVNTDLRASIVFSLHNLLLDPPLARMDLLSCRNVLIYLRAEAQAKVIALFHFALREGGLLLLGGAETVGGADERFRLVSKPSRLYRNLPRVRSGDGVLNDAVQRFRPSNPPHLELPPMRASVMAELCRRVVLEAFAPAAILINHRSEMLYSLGPTDRYLRVAPGHPSLDMPAMARQEARTRLRGAIAEVIRTGRHVTVPGGRRSGEGPPQNFNIDVRPVRSEGRDLLLVAFIDTLALPALPALADDALEVDTTHLAALQAELAATSAELRNAVRDMEIAGEEHKASSDEALSVTEEYQSNNEELMTSKEELQSLNEELTALNSQLHETLERQRTAANDLQNVLYSTDVATIFLDAELRIRFFTPATRQVFGIRASDVGRPLTDLHAIAPDATLIADATAVMHSREPREQEVTTPNGAWFIRRILPYLTYDNSMQGVVITFNDITDRRAISEALGLARREADRSNLAKSRFLAAASHDLRQPMQTLGLLQGLLAKAAEDPRSQALVVRLDETLGAMTGMLNTLLDVNQIEAGTIRPEVSAFPINSLLEAMRAEYQYIAQAQGLDLRVVPCSLCVQSDPRLLGQMLRNLLSNSMKFTTAGKVLLGCRRRGAMLMIQVIDTGIGIPPGELDAIFEEYHQIGNDAREQSRGLGLGLSIVQRLGGLLEHPVRVRSLHGRGSVFSIEVPQVPPVRVETIVSVEPRPLDARASILIVEDDPSLRELLQLLLDDDGYAAHVAADGPAALALVAGGTCRPDLVLADFNLPGGLDGIEVCTRLRGTVRADLPFIILTGDISSDTLRRIAAEGCAKLSKPVPVPQLLAAVRAILDSARPLPPEALHAPSEAALVHVVDDDANICTGLAEMLTAEGYAVATHASAEALLAALGANPQAGAQSCMLLDVALPGLSGLDLLALLKSGGRLPPTIMITGKGDTAMAVRCMKAGAVDFLEKPIARADLLSAIIRALAQARDSGAQVAYNAAAVNRLAGLTERQREVMVMVLAGHPSKNIAADLAISQRTVENHRAAIMRRTGTRSLPALARLALAAGVGE